jgi:site-specific DNA recombinase
MASMNGCGPRRAVLYARVSTEEQVKSGYSLAQQMEALRKYAAREGYEVVEEVQDPGRSGATLARPGMDRVRDLVAAGGVSVVLAQDRDRLVREPAYHYLLTREFEEYGCALRALNDRGDDSPEGQLTEGVLDQIAKYERVKMAERSRRGKLHKARQGKVIAGRMAKYGLCKYGYRFNEARDGLVLDEETMSTVRRIFRMVGVEGYRLFAVKRTLDAEGVRTATGKDRWAPQVIRDYILDDAYKPHTYEEIKELVSPEVAARLDPQERYGVWRFNTHRHQRTEVAVEGPDGRIVYKSRNRRTARPEDEWITVPIPDAGVPREWVEAAREAIKDNRRTSNAGRRFWELSGGIMRCGACGYAMTTHTTTPKKGRSKLFYYYACRTYYKKGRDVCPGGMYIPAAKLEGRIWEAICAILKDPERLRADLDAMIEQERSGWRGDPDREAKLWADKLAEVNRKRARYQEMAASDLITLDELRSRLAELEETRAMAERELNNLRNRQEYVCELERDRDALLDKLEGVAPEALDALAPEERHQVYKMLHLKVIANLDGSYEVSGAFAESFNLESLEVCTLEVSH